MNTTEQPTVVWKWHRQDTRHKSHLVMQYEPVVIPHLHGACGWTAVEYMANNDMSAPCKNCLRASAGLLVGAG